MRHAEKYLGQMNATERERTLKHLQAYSTLYYQGRHNEKVPFEVRTKLQSIQEPERPYVLRFLAKCALVGGSIYLLHFLWWNSCDHIVYPMTH
jgi:hypothetical protein